jgi:hypothetical protein
MGVGLPQIQLVANPMSGFHPIGVVGQSATGRLQASFAEIVNRLLREQEEIAIQAAKAINAEDFKARRAKLYLEYLNLTKAVSNVVLTKVDQTSLTDIMDLASMLETSFSSLEEEIETHGALYFAESDQAEIMFSAVTLKNAYMTIPRFLGVKLDQSLLSQDKELGENFGLTAIWAQFHLEGLMAAMRKNLTVVPDVLSELLEGLRQSVMAYSYVRQALDLRNLLDDRYSDDLGAVEWDADDEALARAE